MAQPKPLPEAWAEFRLAFLQAVLPFFAWLVPKLGMRLKPEYQAILDSRDQ